MLEVGQKTAKEVACAEEEDPEKAPFDMVTNPLRIHMPEMGCYRRSSVMKR